MSKTNASGGDSCLGEDKSRIDFSLLWVQGGIPWRGWRSDKGLWLLGKNVLYIPTQSVGGGVENGKVGFRTPGRDACNNLTPFWGGCAKPNSAPYFHLTSGCDWFSDFLGSPFQIYSYNKSHMFRVKMWVPPLHGLKLRAVFAEILFRRWPHSRQWSLLDMALTALQLLQVSLWNAEIIECEHPILVHCRSSFKDRS